MSPALRNKPFPGESVAGFGGNTIASADDRRLRDELDQFLAAVAGLAEREKLAIGEDGLPVDLNELRRRAKAPIGENCRAIQRHATWIHAIRLEIDERSTKRAEHHKRQQSNARKALRKLVQDAPALDAQMREHASRVAASWRLVERFADALNRVAGSADLENQHAWLQKGVQEAAAALGMTAPEIRPLPNGVPTKAQIRPVLDALHGRGGYSKVKVDLGGADKAPKHAQVLAKAERARSR